MRTVRFAPLQPKTLPPCANTLMVRRGLIGPQLTPRLGLSRLVLLGIAVRTRVGHAQRYGLNRGNLRRVARPGDLVHVQLAGNIAKLLVQEHFRSIRGLIGIQIRGGKRVELQIRERLQMRQIRPVGSDKVELGYRIAGMSLMRVVVAIVNTNIKSVFIDAGFSRRNYAEGSEA